MGGAGRARAGVVVVATAVLVAACGHSGPVTVLPRTTPTPSVTASVTPEPLPTSPSPGPTAAPTQSATPTPSGSVSPSPEAPSPTAVRTTLRRGDEGPKVLALQQRLVELGYWMGTPDGVFGALTEQAVWALQKAAGLQRDAVVGPATRKALADGVRATPRSTSGRVVEIDKTRQLLMVVQDGTALMVLNTSTGSGQYYYSRGSWRVAATPAGHFEVYTQIDGLRISPLGVLWRPKYFVGGIAVHGSPSIPPWPASHGCVRVSNAAIDHVWAQDLVPLGTAVWVY